MWKDSYLIGVELIDEQHKKLFSAVGEMRENLIKGDAPQYKQHLIEITKFLKDYCIYHFETEEGYQRDISFERYLEHKKEHDKLLRDVLKYEKELTESNFAAPIVKGLLGFISTWLVYHVCGEDQQISQNWQAPVALIGTEDIFHESIASTKSVLSILTDTPVQSINHTIGRYRNFSAYICFQVRLVNSLKNTDIYLIYTKEFTFGLLKTMTGSDFTEYFAQFKEVSNSAMQEVSNIISSNIAGILSAITKSGVDVEPPRQIQANEVPNKPASFTAHTKLGDMKVLLD